MAANSPEEVLQALGYELLPDGRLKATPGQLGPIDIVLKARLAGMEFTSELGTTVQLVVTPEPKVVVEGSYVRDIEYPAQTIELPLDQITLAPALKKGQQS